MEDDRPTLDSVAVAAGVSRMTVSNAYNRPDQLSTATREHVLQIATGLGYPGPDPVGRSLRRRRAGTVGVLLTEQLPYAFADPGLVSFLHGVATELGEAGHALLLLATEGNEAHALVRNAIVDGFIVASLAPRDPAVADVLQRRLPIVTWGNLRLPGVPRIGVDNAKAAHEPGRYLVGLGHKRFGIVTFGGAKISDDTAPDADKGAPPDVPGTHLAMRQRASGLRRALTDAGIATTAITVVNAASNTRDAGRRAMTELLDVSPRPTAVFAVTDVLALGALQQAADAHVDVPGEVSIVGFDGTDDAARSVPALTTVSQGLLEQGKWAARLILDTVAGRVVDVPQVRFELVVRDTTAAPPSRR